MDWATVLGVVATVAFLARMLPQPVKLWRTGVPDGVSPLMALNMTITELAWLAYGLIAGLVPVWAVSLPAFPLGVWTVVLLRRQVTRNDLVLAGLWLAAIVAAWSTGALGAVLAVSVIVQYGPQVWTAVRQSNLQGIAPTTWRLAFVDAITWGAYGLAVGDRAVLGYTVTLSVSAAIILVRLRQTGALAPSVVIGDPVALAPATDAA